MIAFNMNLFKYYPTAPAPVHSVAHRARPRSLVGPTYVASIEDISIHHARLQRRHPSWLWLAECGFFREGAAKKTVVHAGYRQDTVDRRQIWGHPQFLDCSVTPMQEWI